jgi:hypothetical protein
MESAGGIVRGMVVDSGKGSILLDISFFGVLVSLEFGMAWHGMSRQMQAVMHYTCSVR